jgi:Ser/Thr protein kinase RdoA (MazF antagonist)
VKALDTTDVAKDATARIEAAIREAWGIVPNAVRDHAGGMNSRTWVVTTGDRRWVAKAVPADARVRFGSGLAVAAIVDAAGIPAGVPEPTRDGRTWISIDDQVLALLRFVDGDGLVGDEAEEQGLIGSTLARAHQALIGAAVPGTATFHSPDADAAHLDVEPWVRPAVRDAIEAYDALPPATLTFGLLHTDPAPEAFLFDARSRTCGLIDWDTGLVGPLMYDVASAVMYLGGSARANSFLDAYLAVGTISPTELDRSLAPMLRLRWAVQADYFAHRLATNDLTGIADARDNRKGLDDARRAMCALEP